jgi:hypothetical protein
LWSGVVGSATDPTAALWQAPATWQLAQVVEMQVVAAGRGDFVAVVSCEL